MKVKQLKKLTMVVLFLSIMLLPIQAKAEFIETGEEVEVKEYAPKMFIYEALQPWLTQDASDIYFKKYQARKSVEMEGPKPENVRIWIKDTKPGDGNYTHVITVLLPYENVILDG